MVHLITTGQKHLRGRGACRKFGISSWEATSFARKAVQVNWRAIVVREDAQLVIRIERPRGFAAPSFVAILIASRSTSKRLLRTEMVMLSDAANLIGLSVEKSSAICRSCTSALALILNSSHFTVISVKHSYAVLLYSVTLAYYQYIHADIITL